MNKLPDAQKQLKNKTMSKNQKLLVVILCIWSFFNTYLLLKNIDIVIGGQYYSYGNEHEIYKTSLFYPFTSYPYVSEHTITHKEYNMKAFGYFNTNFYDYTEYLVYVGGVWMVFFLFRLLSKKSSLT